MGDLELRYAHLSNRDSPARKANREALQKRIEEIQAEQAEKNVALRGRAAFGAPPPLRIADRYAAGRKHG